MSRHTFSLSQPGQRLVEMQKRPTSTRQTEGSSDQVLRFDLIKARAPRAKTIQVIMNLFRASFSLSSRPKIPCVLTIVYLSIGVPLTTGGDKLKCVGRSLNGNHAMLAR